MSIITASTPIFSKFANQLVVSGWSISDANQLIQNALTYMNYSPLMQDQVTDLSNKGWIIQYSGGPGTYTDVGNKIIYVGNRSVASSTGFDPVSNSYITFTPAANFVTAIAHEDGHAEDPEINNYTYVGTNPLVPGANTADGLLSEGKAQQNNITIANQIFLNSSDGMLLPNGLTIAVGGDADTTRNMIAADHAGNYTNAIEIGAASYIDNFQSGTGQKYLIAEWNAYLESFVSSLPPTNSSYEIISKLDSLDIDSASSISFTAGSGNLMTMKINFQDGSNYAVTYHLGALVAPGGTSGGQGLQYGYGPSPMNIQTGEEFTDADGNQFREIYVSDSTINIDGGLTTAVVGTNDTISGVAGANIVLQSGDIGDKLSYSGNNILLTGALNVVINNNSAIITYQKVDLDGDAATLQATITPLDPIALASASGTTTYQTPSQFYSAIGSAFGSSLGGILGGSNPFARIALSSTMGPVMGEVVRLIEGFGDVNLSGELDTFASGLPNSVETAGAGAIAGYFFGDLVDSLGINGLPATVVNTFGGFAVSSIASNLAMGGDAIAGKFVDGNQVGTNLGNIASWELVGAEFVGTEIAQAIFDPHSVEGSEGEAVSGAIAGAGAAYALLMNPLWAAVPEFYAAVVVVVILADLLGGVIGDLFGETTSHIAGADFTITSSQVSSVGYVYHDDGVAVQAGQVADAIQTALNNVLAAVHGTITNLDALTIFGVAINSQAKGVDGHADGMVYYYDTFDNTGVMLSRSVYWASDTQVGTVLDYAVMRELSEMVFSGGDSYMERAVDATLRSSIAPTTSTLGGYIQIAADYEFYEANRSTINALIAAGYSSTDNTASAYARKWLGEMAIFNSLGFGTSVQGGTDNDQLGVVSETNPDGTTTEHNVLIGGGGNDHYVVNPGDGAVTILNGLSSDNEANGILNLNRSGLTFSYNGPGNPNTGNVTFSLSGADLVIGMPGSQPVTIRGWTAGSFAQLSQIEFDGGATVIGNDVIQLASGEVHINEGPGGGGLVDDANLGVAGDNRFTDSSNSIVGGDGEDVLVGGSGANTFMAGGGMDALYGGGGTDTYQLFAPGQITIYNNESEATGTLVSGAPVESGNLQLWTAFDQVSFSGDTSNDLVVRVAGTTTLVVVDRWFTPNNHAFELSSIKLSDGTNITFTDNTNFLSGNTTYADGSSVHEKFYLADLSTVATVFNFFAPNGYQTQTAITNADGSSSREFLLDNMSWAGGYDTLLADGAHDTLSGDSGTSFLVAQSTGSYDTLIAAVATTTLVGSANNDTLDCAPAGSGIVEYTVKDVSINLAPLYGAATNNDTGLSDVLVDATVAIATGAHDTLTGGTGVSTLFASTLEAKGNFDTLIGGGANSVTALMGDGQGGKLSAGTGGIVIAGYSADNVTVSLAASDTTNGSATVAGSTLSDTLIDITAVEVSGNNDTVIGGNAESVMFNNGTGTATFIDGDAATTIYGGAGSNIYKLNRTTTGALTIDNGVDSTGTAQQMGPSGTLSFTGAIAAADLGFALGLNGNDLVASVDDAPANAPVAAIVQGWLANDYAKLQSIQVADGTTIFYSGGNVLNGATPGTTNINGISAQETYYLNGLTAIAARINYFTGGGSNFETDVVLRAGAVIDSKTLLSDSLSIAGPANTLIASGVSDTLNAAPTGAEVLIANGNSDTLIAGAAASTLTALGSGDVLYAGSNAGTTLVGNTTGDTTLNFNVDGQARNLSTLSISNISHVTVSGANDTITGFASGTTYLSASGQHEVLIGGSGGTSFLTASGTSDTLEGSSGGTTEMFGQLNGTTLMAGTGGVSGVVYGQDGASVRLAVGTATVGSASDTLVGITVGLISGLGSTLVAGAGVNTLTATGTNETLIAGAGASTLIATGTGDTLYAGGNAATVLNGSAFTNNAIAYLNLDGKSAALSGGNISLIRQGIAAGDNDTLSGLTGGMTTLTATGSGDTLIARDSTTTLIGNGTSTQMFGVAGDVLIGGTANTSVFMNSGADGETLTAGAGVTYAAYSADSVIVNLFTQTAKLGSGATITDTLSGITRAEVLGNSDTLTGGANTSSLYLFASGNSDRLVGGAGTSTLKATGGSDTLVAGSGGGTLTASGSSDVYNFATTAGSVVINNGAAGATAASNELDFGTGITDGNLWFAKSGNNLIIDLMGTTKSLTVAGWYSGSASNPGSDIATITAGGYTLLASQVAQLAAAMATFSAGNHSFDPTIATQVPGDSTLLQSAITAAWHH